MQMDNGSRGMHLPEFLRRAWSQGPLVAFGRQVASVVFLVGISLVAICFERVSGLRLTFDEGEWICPSQCAFLFAQTFMLCIFYRMFGELQLVLESYWTKDLSLIWKGLLVILQKGSRYNLGTLLEFVQSQRGLKSQCQHVFYLSLW